MKKIFSLILVGFASVILVACGSAANANKPVEGTYYDFYDSDKTIGVSKLVVRDNVVYLDNHEYEIDAEKQEFVEKAESASYEYKDDIIKFGKWSYVREGSDTYKKMLKEGYTKD